MTTESAMNSEQNPKIKFENFRTDIVTEIAFLIGVPIGFLVNGKFNYGKDILEKMQNDKRTMTIRCLSLLRWQIFRFYPEITAKISGMVPLWAMGDDLLNSEAIEYLKNRDIDISRTKNPSKNITLNLAIINQFILDNIENIKEFFPNWIKFDYIKRLFIMPDCEAGVNGRNLTDKNTASAIIEKIHKIRKEFLDQRKIYPFGYFFMWPVPLKEDDGNILYNDAKFLELLYKVNNDEFKAREYVVDAPQLSKQMIYDFINEAENVSVVVDCENANPYSLAATILNLDQEGISKIRKIILIDDANTSPAWDYMEEICKIKIEHKETERILENKSLVDVVMTAIICKEHYGEGIDSIFIVSSDSDFCGVMDTLKDARFFVLNERSYASPNTIHALNMHGIRHCYMDSFALDRVQEFKEKVLLNLLRASLDEFNKNRIWNLPLDLHGLADALFANAKIRDVAAEQLEQEKTAFIQKHLKRGFALLPEEVEGKQTLRMDFFRK